MSKLILNMMVSLDGFIEGPNREIDWHMVDEEFNQYAIDLLDSVDTILLVIPEEITKMKQSRQGGKKIWLFLVVPALHKVL